MIFSGKYAVIDELGRGGMGVVYRVRHLQLDTILALKVLPLRFAGDPELVERFRREAKVMARLRHPHIAREKESTVVLVIDGEESCGGDPCATIRSLREKGIRIRLASPSWSSRSRTRRRSSTTGSRSIRRGRRSRRRSSPPIRR